MRVEQVETRPYPEQERKHIGDFRIDKALDTSFKEPGGLQYLTTPLDIYKTDTPEGTRFDMVSRHTPLDSRQLRDFLNFVAPYPDSNQSLPAIEADWNLLERATAGSETQIARAGRHAHQNGTAWTDFIPSLPGLLTVIRDDEHLPRFFHEFNGLEHHYSWHISKRVIIEDLAKTFLKSPEISFKSIEETTSIDIKKSFYENVARSLKGRKIVRMNNQTIPELHKRYIAFPHDKKFRTVEQTLNTLLTISGDQADTLSRIKDKLYDKADMDDGSLIHCLKADLAEGENFSKARNNPVIESRGRFKAQFIELRLANGRKARFLEKNSIVADRDLATVEPVFSWIKSPDGQRQLVIDRNTDHYNLTKYHDGTLGVLLADYAQPALRSDWEPVIRGQEIEAVQVPVLALYPKYRDRALNSNMVKAAESLSE